MLRINVQVDRLCEVSKSGSDVDQAAEKRVRRHVDDLPVDSDGFSGFSSFFGVCEGVYAEEEQKDRLRRTTDDFEWAM